MEFEFGQLGVITFLYYNKITYEEVGMVLTTSLNFGCAACCEGGDELFAKRLEKAVCVTRGWGEAC